MWDPVAIGETGAIFFFIPTLLLIGALLALNQWLDEKKERPLHRMAQGPFRRGP
jgi:hypothetical protein